MPKADRQQILPDRYLDTTDLVERADAGDLYQLARPCGHCRRWTRSERLRYGHCPDCMADPQIAAEAKAVQLM